MNFPGIYKNGLVPFKIAGNCFRTKLQFVFKNSRDLFVNPLFFSHLSHWRHAVSWPRCSAPWRGPWWTIGSPLLPTCSPSASSPHSPPRKIRIGAPFFLPRVRSAEVVAELDFVVPGSPRMNQGPLRGPPRLSLPPGARN